MADLKRFFKKTVSEDRHKQAASVVPEMRRIFQNQCETSDQNDRR